MNIAMRMTLAGLIQALRLDAQCLADAVEFGAALDTEPQLGLRRPTTRTMRNDDDERRRE